MMMNQISVSCVASKLSKKASARLYNNMWLVLQREIQIHLELQMKW